jgi:hypothetical protein
VGEGQVVCGAKVRSLYVRAEQIFRWLCQPLLTIQHSVTKFTGLWLHSVGDRHFRGWYEMNAACLLQLQSSYLQLQWNVRISWVTSFIKLRFSTKFPSLSTHFCHLFVRVFAEASEFFTPAAVQRRRYQSGVLGVYPQGSQKYGSPRALNRGRVLDSSSCLTETFEFVVSTSVSTHIDLNWLWRLYSRIPLTGFFNVPEDVGHDFTRRSLPLEFVLPLGHTQ